jgi:hypothetical protein
LRQAPAPTGSGLGAQMIDFTTHTGAVTQRDRGGRSGEGVTPLGRGYVGAMWHAVYAARRANSAAGAWIPNPPYTLRTEPRLSGTAASAAARRRATRTTRAPSSTLPNDVRDRNPGLIMSWAGVSPGSRILCSADFSRIGWQAELTSPVGAGALGRRQGHVRRLKIEPPPPFE